MTARSGSSRNIPTARPGWRTTIRTRDVWPIGKQTAARSSRWPARQKAITSWLRSPPQKDSARSRSAAKARAMDGNTCSTKKSHAAPTSDGVRGRSSPRGEMAPRIFLCVSLKIHSIRALRANFCSGRWRTKRVRFCRHSTDYRCSGFQRKPVISVSWFCPGLRKTPRDFSKATARAWKNIRSPTSAISLPSTRARSK